MSKLTARTQRRGDDFWGYSLALYRSPAVARACLALQDRAGADVNMLLFCCWWSALGRGSIADRSLMRIVAAARRWQDGTIAPLRRIRLGFKPASGSVPTLVVALCDRVLAAELAAERLAQQAIFEAAFVTSGAKPRRPARRSADAVINLVAYAGRAGIKLTRPTCRDLEEIVATAFPVDGRAAAAIGLSR